MSNLIDFPDEAWESLVIDYVDLLIRGTRQLSPGSVAVTGRRPSTQSVHVVLTVPGLTPSTRAVTVRQIRATSRRAIVEHVASAFADLVAEVEAHRFMEIDAHWAVCDP